MMYKALFFLLFLITLDGFSQEIPAPFVNNKVVALGEVRDYYLNTYQNLTSCDSVALLVSKKLKQTNTSHYVFNELARIQILSLQGNKVLPLEQLEKLRQNQIDTTSLVLLGYYYNVYGSILYHFEKPLKAQSKYKLAIMSFLNTTDSAGLKGNLINLGNTYLDLDNSDSALYCYNEALRLELKGINIFGETLKSNIAQAYLRNGLLDSAKYYYQDLVSIFKKEHNSYKLVNALLNLGITFQKNNELDSAIFYLHETRKLAIKYSLPGALKKSLVQLAKTYQSKQQYEKALNYFFSYDSLLSLQHKANVDQKIGELKQSHQKQIHTTEQKLILEQLKNQKRRTQFLLITSLLIGSILILILFSYLKIRTKNKVLVQSKLTTAKHDKRSFELNDDNIDKVLIDKLIKAFKQERVYLDSKLSLEKLAKKIGSNRTYVSKTINAYFKIPFNELINQYRIDEACVLLTSKEYANYSIEGIAQTVGYHNLSSFNTAFRRLTGTTPSKFKTNSQSIG
jgi:YesN/AraC family two-component response regulator